MCITAHPDDESGAFGGALLMAHAQGVETSVICLTEGQAASHRGEAENGEELARMRRAEFAAAGKVLGVMHGEVLHYPDGKLAGESMSEMIGALVERIRRYRPQVVLAFGGEGGVNLHRDHTIASLAATAAFHWAGRSAAYSEQSKQGLATYAPQKLYYSATAFFLTRNEEEASVAPRTGYSLRIKIAEWRQQKLDAFRQHSSQAVLLDIHKDALERNLDVEYYLLAAARGIRNVSEDSYLFEGVVAD